MCFTHVFLVYAVCLSRDAVRAGSLGEFEAVGVGEASLETKGGKYKSTFSGFKEIVLCVRTPSS